MFFATPQGLRFGDAKKNALKPGGIFVPIDYTAKSPAYFYIGTPPSVKKVADFWQDLYVDEGATWHIENPRTGPQPPPDALTVVGAWVAGYSPGSWQIKRAAAPVYRFAPPSGWLVALTLCPAGKSPTDRDAYPEKKFSVVLDHGRVAWVLQTAEIKKNGKYIIALPPDQLE